MMLTSSSRDRTTALAGLTYTPLITISMRDGTVFYLRRDLYSHTATSDSMVSRVAHAELEK